MMDCRLSSHLFVEVQDKFVVLIEMLITTNICLLLFKTLESKT
jgi:hypothetical protein